MADIDEDEAPRCLEQSPDCKGKVEFHLRDSDWKSFPRCDFHQERREARRENSMERYANSDVVPEWFSEADAGERWDDD